MRSTTLLLCVALVGCLGKGRDRRPDRDDTIAPEPIDVPPPSCPGSPGAVLRDIPYASIPGVDPALLSLDVYQPLRPASCGPAPIVVWVHGGAWAIGDKANAMDEKVALFNGAGWLVVSINYRLSPDDDPPTFEPGRVMYPTHPRDVAAAIHWVRMHADEIGGDPSRLVLLGHSAGAHLVALVSTDEAFLGAHGDSLSAIRCTASFDTEAYDLPRTLAQSTPRQHDILINAFGSDPAVHAHASPITHVTTGAPIPAFQIAVRGDSARQETQHAFADALRDVGVEVRTIDASSLSHAEVDNVIGVPGETLVTPALMSFFHTCLHGTDDQTPHL